MSTKKMSLLAAALVAVVLGAAVVPAALAQNSSEDSGDTQATPSPDDRAAEAQSDFAAALADELGISEARVAAALEQVQSDLAAQFRAEHRAALDERLDAAVAGGDLTRAQANAILDAYDAGVLGGFGGHHGFGAHGFGGPRPGGWFGPAVPADATSA